MGKALYRQYRSASFDKVIGQDHITTTLKNSPKNDKVAHAYLLTGPRGVGKTSVARIFAHEVNKLEYNPDTTHIDIIEIDAASNRRIDEVRELREKARIAPAAARYKVYIIDEIHMLTREAFNALLKTLRKTEYVIFILATTDIHKLPDTIISRCITFTFRPISQSDLFKHLKKIAKAEKIDITDEAIKLLADHGDGSFRDSISLLDQVKSIGGKIDDSEVQLVLGVASKSLIDAVFNAVETGNAKELDKVLETAYTHGASEIKLTKQIAAKLRGELINGSLKLSYSGAMDLLKDLLDVPSSARPRDRLELSLLTQLYKANPDTVIRQPQIIIEQKDVAPMVDAAPEPLQEVTKEETQSQATGVIKIDQDLWASVLDKLKNQNNTLYGIARMAEPGFHNNKLSLSFKFPFHFKQVNQPKNKSLLSVIMEELGHKNLQIEIMLSENSPQKKPANKDKEIANITNIFGKGEVLES